MTDLLLHDLEIITKESLVMTLSNEKREMFGEKGLAALERRANYLSTNSFAGPVTRPRKERRGRKCYRVKP
jgi:hypothetical protein